MNLKDFGWLGTFMLLAYFVRTVFFKRRGYDGQR
jgi:hypothetical protein